MKVIVTIDLENRYSGEANLLETCVRDGVVAFNQHVGHAAKVALVQLCCDESGMQALSNQLREKRGA